MIHLIALCAFFLMVLLVLLVLFVGCGREPFGNQLEDCDILSLSIPNEGPMEKVPVTDGFILFEIDCGGLNNIRMQLEVLVGLSKLSNRTLVLPPKTNWYLLDQHLIEDVWDTDLLGSKIPLLTYDQWLTMNGHNANISYAKFFRNLREGTYGNYSEPPWGPSVTVFKNEFLGDPTKIWYFFCTKDNKYKPGNRMFGNIRCYYRDNPEIREFILDSLRYRRKYFLESKRILRNLGLLPGRYNAIHVRVWETSQYKKSPPDMVLQTVSDMPPSLPILVLSQKPIETITEKLTKMPDTHKIVYPPRIEDPLEKAIIDMLLVVSAKKFVGSPLSTYSIGIMELRTIFSCDIIDKTPYFLDGSQRKKCNGGTNFDKVIP